MNPHHFQEFMQDYATHFDLLKDISFGTSVKRVTRNEANTRWLVEIESDGKTETLEFDKVAFCHGYQTKADLPVFDGQEKFKGTMLHGQQYRRYVRLQPGSRDIADFLDPKSSPVRMSSWSA
jgi:dimethylaniline monooxygenase (N-oxide forming)